MEEKRLKIGLFIDTFFPMVDGVVMVVDNYAKRLAKFSDVYVFAPDCGDCSEDKNRNYKVIRCNSMKVPFLDYSLPVLNRKFKEELNGINLDIVHVHSPFTLGKAGVKYAKKHHVPVIATMHSQYKKDFKRAVKLEWLASLLTKNIIKQVFNKCDECWAVNSEVAKIFHDEYKYKTLPYVQNNATDMMIIQDKGKSDKEINERYNIAAEEHVFLFVGRINKLKNIMFIVDSLKIVKDKNIKYKMLFVGEGQDEEELREKVTKNEMQNDVIFCGKIFDRELMTKIYSRAELFLFPSLYDASSLVQIEAASQKTPTVFIEGAATAATVTNNRNGFIAKNDIGGYANKIIEIMNDKELYDKVSNGSYAEIYKNWDNKVEEAYKQYLEICSKYCSPEGHLHK